MFIELTNKPEITSLEKNVYKVILRAPPKSILVLNIAFSAHIEHKILTDGNSQGKHIDSRPGPD